MSDQNTLGDLNRILFDAIDRLNERDLKGENLKEEIAKADAITGLATQKICSVHEDGAFVFYHSGSTAAKTPYDKMHKLSNSYCVVETSLGGNRG